MLRKNGKISKATLKRRRPVGKRKIEVIAMNEHVLAIEHVDTKIGGGQNQFTYIPVIMVIVTTCTPMFKNGSGQSKLKER